MSNCYYTSLYCLDTWFEWHLAKYLKTPLIMLLDSFDMVIINISQEWLLVILLLIKTFLQAVSIFYCIVSHFIKYNTCPKLLGASLTMVYMHIVLEKTHCIMYHIMSFFIMHDLNVTIYLCNYLQRLSQTWSCDTNSNRNYKEAVLYWDDAKWPMPGGNLRSQVCIQ